MCLSELQDQINLPLLRQFGCLRSQDDDPKQAGLSEAKSRSIGKPIEDPFQGHALPNYRKSFLFYGDNNFPRKLVALAPSVSWMQELVLLNGGNQ